jgi:hypothetical protein
MNHTWHAIRLIQILLLVFWKRAYRLWKSDVGLSTKLWLKAVAGGSDNRLDMTNKTQSLWLELVILNPVNDILVNTSFMATLFKAEYIWEFLCCKYTLQSAFNSLHEFKIRQIINSTAYIHVDRINRQYNTYLLTVLSPSWEAANCAATQELPSILKETQRFITVFTIALHWSLSWARSIQSIPSHYISLRSGLIVSTHLRLGLPSCILPSGFPTNIQYAFLFFPILPNIINRFMLEWMVNFHKLECKFGGIYSREV